MPKIPQSLALVHRCALAQSGQAHAPSLPASAAQGCLRARHPASAVELVRDGQRLPSSGTYPHALYTGSFELSRGDDLELTRGGELPRHEGAAANFSTC